MYVSHGSRAGFSEQVKLLVSIPVIASGRIKSPVMADRLVGEGKADLVAMGRAFLADPEFVQKARVGKVSDIRPCIAECLGCIGYLLRDGEATCTVNPAVGRERALKQIPLVRRSSAKRVLVAGAGCAGLEAARQAALAGNEVIVCEKRPRMGGQLRLAASIPQRQEVGDLLTWYERELHRLQVEVRLNSCVDEALLDEIKPDVVIVATGSLPQVPLGFLGNLANAKTIEVLAIDDLMENKKPTGEGVLVVGEDEIALQVVDFVSESCRRAFTIERDVGSPPKMAEVDRVHLEERISRKNVERYREVHALEILPEDEVWVVQAGGRQRLPGIDTIVLTGQRRPNRGLADTSRRKGFETWVIGDADGVASEGQGTILAAIAAGYDVGRRI